MKFRSICKKNIVSVLCAITLAVSAIGVSADNLPVFISSALDVSTNMGTYSDVILSGGSATITVNGIRVNSENKGVVAIDIENNFVSGKSSKLDKDNYLELMQENGAYSPTVVKSSTTEYRANDSGYSRFYVPVDSSNGSANIKFTAKGTKLTNDKIKVMAYTVSNTDNQLKRLPDNVTLDASNFDTYKNEVSTYIDSNESATVYSAIIGKNKDTFILKPSNNPSTIRLYLGAGKGKSVSMSKRFDVKYYANLDVYRRINNDYKKYKDGYVRNGEYKESTISAYSEYSSLDFTWNNTDGFIEVKGEDMNNFLLNVKMQSISNVNPNPSKPNKDEIKPEVNKLNPTVERISKNTRYETAIELSKKAFNSSKNAIVVSGENFADALSGGALANTLKAPLLLVDNNKSNIEMVKSELSRLGVENVYVLGGEKSVALSTEKELANGRKSVRLSGADRYATSKAVYDEFVKVANSSRDAIVVNGTQFADALSAGPLSAKKGMPILLTDGKMIKSDLNRSGNIIIGGFNSMGTVFKGSRINGSDRYETSTLIASKYFEGVDRAVLASGKNYPDGLASISLYNKYYAPLLLTENNSLPTSVANYLKSAKVRNVYIAGGIGSVSNSVYNAVKGL